MPEPWPLVFSSLFFMTLTGAIAWTLASTLASSVKGAWSGFLAGMILIAITAITFINGSESLTMGFAALGSGLGSCVWLWPWAPVSSYKFDDRMLKLALLVVLAVVVANVQFSLSFGVGFGLLILVGFLSAYWSGFNAHSLAATWSGIGGSAIGLAILTMILSRSQLPYNSVQNEFFTVVYWLQVILMGISLKLVNSSLSTFYYPKFQSFVLLNVACLLGILCGAGLISFGNYVR